MSSLPKIAQAVIISARPNTWLRIWGEMIVAATLASYPQFNLLSFAKGFLAVSPLLWSAGYMINDLTDTKLDKQHEFRKERPITQGEIKRKTTILVIIFLILLALIIGLSISAKFVFLLAVLLASQLLYTLPPTRLKEKFIWDIAVNGVNSVVRFLLGWTTQIALHPFTLYPLIMLVAIKIIFFIGHRVQNRSLEIKNNIKSTVTVLSMKQLNSITFIGMGVFIVSYIISVFKGIFPPLSLLSIPFGSLPLLRYISRRKFSGILVAQERNLDFRNALYFGYFIFTNFIALTLILWKK